MVVWVALGVRAVRHSPDVWEDRFLIERSEFWVALGVRAVHHSPDVWEDRFLIERSKFSGSGPPVLGPPSQPY